MESPPRGFTYWAKPPWVLQENSPNVCSLNSSSCDFWFISAHLWVFCRLQQHLLAENEVVNELMILRDRDDPQKLSRHSPPNLINRSFLALVTKLAESSVSLAKRAINLFLQNHLNEENQPTNQQRWRLIYRDISRLRIATPAAAPDIFASRK